MTFVNVYTVVVIAQLESGITVTLVATNHVNTAAVVANVWMTQTLIYSEFGTLFYLFKNCSKFMSRNQTTFNSTVPIKF